MSLRCASSPELLRDPTSDDGFVFITKFVFLIQKYIGRVGKTLEEHQYIGTRLTVDTTNSMGRFFLTVIGGMAELESGQISERTKAAMKHIKISSKRFTGEIYGWDC